MNVAASLRWLVLLGSAGAVVACGSSDDGTSPGNVGSDPCLGSFVESTNCGNVNSTRAVLTIASVSGDAPSQFMTGSTSCSTTFNTVGSVYSDLKGEFPSACDSDWALQLRINEGENSTSLTANGNTGTASIPAGSAAVVLDTQLNGCKDSAETFLATGQGALGLKVISADAPSCAELSFTDLELAGNAGSFRFTGTLRAKFIKVGAQ